MGGGPEALLSDAVREFHRANAIAARRWPGRMLAVTTHDTKRTADVRARLDVLSEIPEEWAERVHAWRRLNVPFKHTVRGRRVPEPATVVHTLQAMVGIWPLDPLGVGDLDLLRERLGEYMVKAVREAKVRTTWTDPDEEYERALLDDIAALLDPRRSPRFLDDLERFVARVARAGLWNSLARTVLQLASPGVPDIYQGDDLWNFALVDPDNRRPVDFTLRERLLAELEREMADGADRAGYLRALMAVPEDGRLKLHVLRAGLTARRDRPAPFGSPHYASLDAAGPAAERVLAFGRGDDGARLIAVVPRLIASHVVGGGAPTDAALWKGTTLPLPAGWPSRWRCALSGASLQADPAGGLQVSELFGILPVALLLDDSAA